MQQVEHRYSIRLADGSHVFWTPQEIVAHDEQWTVDLATLSSEQLERGCERLRRCLAHAEDEECEMCQGNLEVRNNASIHLTIQT